MSAEWRFLEIPEMVSACRQAASIAKTRFDWADWEEMYHEALAYLAERPQLQHDWFEGRWEHPGRMARYIYRQALRERYIRESRRRDATVSWELLEGGSDWQ